MSWARRGIIAGLAAIVVAAAVLLWRQPAPNVLWISVDSLRADRLPVYGFDGQRTPNIDYLASQGVVFERAFTDAPWTTAAMASAMTGRFAVHHGLRTPFAALPAGETTVAEVLAAQGWQTGAIVGTFFLDRVFGLDRGFADYDDRYDSPIEEAGRRPHFPSRLYADVDVQRTYLARKRRHDSFRSDSAVGDATIAWLRRVSRRRPFFLWVHFFGPHQRKRVGDDYAQAIERALAPYDGYVAGVDAQIGRVLLELNESGRLGETIIVFQGDHGEDRLQHGELGHGRALYDSVLRVPLIFAWPGHLAPARVAEMVRTVDVAPTVLSLLGLAAPAAMDGRSLLPRPAVAAKEPPPLVAETLLSAEAPLLQFQRDGTLAAPGVRRRALRTERWKYIASEPHPLINFGVQPPLAAGAAAGGTEELFDLERDPGETSNVAGRHPDLVRQLRERLAAETKSAR